LNKTETKKETQTKELLDEFNMIEQTT